MTRQGMVRRGSSISPRDVSCCLVTRGNVPLDQILASFPDFDEVEVYDNSQRPDLGVYGRYVAVSEAKNEIIYTQDDDCLVPVMDVLARYERGRLTGNMPESRWQGYPDSVMVGWGAVHDRELPEKAFSAWRRHMDLGYDEALIYDHGWFQRTCDIVFSALTPRTVIDVGFQHLPWAEGPGRMWTSNPDHGPERDRMVELCRRIRTWPDDDRRVPRQP